MANSHSPQDRDWSLAEAKNGLSEVVRRARAHGPQTISVRGERAAVVLSASEYDALTTPDAPKTLKDLLRAMNLEGVDVTRDPRPPRDIDL
ncbi:MAG TPA: type II toxin-antitoxin system Phd/YefM family antitoxin [Caulobacteraceae bacterium]|jgi:prevent-host-death family protein